MIAMSRVLGMSDQHDETGGSEMRFSLKALFAVANYCSIIFAAIHHFSAFRWDVPVHSVNVGLLRVKIDHQFHDIELVVWLPLLVLVSYFYFRLSTASWNFRLAGEMGQIYFR